MSNTGFGQDRPYGAIDDDDDFIDEWRASWEPAARTHVDDVIEPVAISPSEPAQDVEHVYDEGMYAPAPESESDETPAAEFVPPTPVADPYDLESIHANAAFDAPVNDLGAAIVSAHPLAPVATPAPAAEPEPVIEPEAADVTESEPVAEPEPVTEGEPAAEGEPEPSGAEAFAEPEPEPEPDAGEQPEALAQPEVIAEPEAEADEPGPEPLIAPDDVSDLDLVDWEPQPSSAQSDTPAEGAAPEESLVEPEPEPDPDPEPEPEPEAMDASTEPDHSIGLTGAAAAGLAAASAWGVWSGTPVVPAMPAGNPMEIGEPEPVASLPSEPEGVTSESFEPEAADFVATDAPEDSQPGSEAATDQPETHDVADQQPEPVAAEAEPTPNSYQPSGLFVPEPEVLTIPEPVPSDATEAPDFPVGLATMPIPEPDMYAAPGRSPFTATEPEQYVIPEPEPVSAASVFAPPTGDTTPIPEPGFATAQPTSETPIEQTGEPTEPFETTDTAPSALAPEYAAHEQVHTLAAENPAYDLIVDVSSIVGVALRFAPTESAGVAPQAEDLPPQSVVNDDAEPWAPPAEPESQPDPEPEPWAPPAEPESQPEPQPHAEAEHQPAPEPWSPTPEATPSDSAVAEHEATPDPWAFTPPPIPESIFAPAPVEEPAPAWTPPSSAPEPSPSVVPEDAAADEPGEAPSWTMPASVWGEPAPDAQPISDGQPVPPQPENEGDHSKWFDRAKMWAANNLYDPDEDDSVIKPQDGHEHDEQNR